MTDTVKIVVVVGNPAQARGRVWLPRLLWLASRK